MNIALHKPIVVLLTPLVYVKQWVMGLVLSAPELGLRRSLASPSSLCWGGDISAFFLHQHLHGSQSRKKSFPLYEYTKGFSSTVLLLHILMQEQVREA